MSDKINENLQGPSHLTEGAITSHATAETEKVPQSSDGGISEVELQNIEKLIGFAIKEHEIMKDQLSGNHDMGLIGALLRRLRKPILKTEIALWMIRVLLTGCTLKIEHIEEAIEIKFPTCLNCGKRQRLTPAPTLRLPKYSKIVKKWWAACIKTECILPL